MSREDIKAKARKFIGGPELHIHDAGRFVDGIVDMVLDAAKPRTVTTAEELDRLGFQAVVLDAYRLPYVCERHRTDGTRNEWKPCGMDYYIDSDDILFHGPATIVHEGES